MTQGLGPLFHQPHGPGDFSDTILSTSDPDYPLSKAVSQVENLARKTLPATISTSFQGTAEAFRSSVERPRSAVC